MKKLLLALTSISLSFSAFANPEPAMELIESKGETIPFTYQNKEHMLFIGDQVYRNEATCVLKRSSIQAKVSEDHNKLSPVYVVDTVDIVCPQSTSK
jgi:hypothetical protein